MHHLAMHFGISVGLVYRIIHHIIPYLHSWAVPKYIRWHSMAEWRRLAGIYPEWPHVVGILDCTPFRISKPKGNNIFTFSPQYLKDFLNNILYFNPFVF